MAYTIAIDRGRGLTRVWFDGTTTGRDIIAATDELVGRPGYDDAFDQLWSLANVTKLLIDVEEMADLVANDQALVQSGQMGRVRVAIVVAGELRKLAIHFYEYQMRVSGQYICLFDTEAEAEAWLRGEGEDCKVV